MAPRRRCRSSTPATCNHGGVRLGGRGRTTRAHQAGERTRAHPLKVAEGRGVAGNDVGDDLAQRRPRAAVHTRAQRGGGYGARASKLKLPTAIWERKEDGSVLKPYWFELRLQRQRGRVTASFGSCGQGR